MGIDRRAALAAAAGLGGAALLAGCAAKSTGSRFRWNMVTTWPADFPGPGEAARRLATMVDRATHGRLKIRVHGGGEYVPSFGVFDAVSTGHAEIGHGAAHFWQAERPAAALFTAVPFGLNAIEMDAWIQTGGGLELWRELYADAGVIPFAAGSLGAQTAGWYNREITAVTDFRGLRIRMPGLGGEVLRRLGAEPVNVAGRDLFQALKSGAIDAAKWGSPSNDLALGLHRLARYCYYPGWQEPTTTLECLVNRAAFESLPEDLSTVLATACRAVHVDTLADATTRNAKAIADLRAAGAIFRQLPGPVLASLRRASAAVMQRVGAHDALSQRTLTSFRAFRDSVRTWHAMSEVAFYQARQ